MNSAYDISVDVCTINRRNDIIEIYIYICHSTTLNRTYGLLREIQLIQPSSDIYTT